MKLTLAETGRFLHGRPTESQIRTFLASDPTLLAAAFARPKDEYIVFQQFQLTEANQVDYVLFTGRSRMDVIFVEIKGADFNFLVRDSMPNAQVARGIDQVASRFEYPKKDYRRFHDQMHSVRRRVETGETIYQSIRSKALEVSEDKEVVYAGVVIAGTEIDDVRECPVRERLEHHGKHYITCHSWQSFCRRIVGR